LQYRSQVRVVSALALSYPMRNSAMVKILRWYISVMLGGIAILLGVLILPSTFAPHATGALGFINGALLVAGIGILDERWRTRRKRTATARKQSDNASSRQVSQAVE
jgi:membrane protein involved in colicin uptake